MVQKVTVSYSNKCTVLQLHDLTCLSLVMGDFNLIMYLFDFYSFCNLPICIFAQFFSLLFLDGVGGVDCHEINLSRYQFLIDSKHRGKHSHQLYSFIFHIYISSFQSSQFFCVARQESGFIFHANMNQYLFTPSIKIFVLYSFISCAKFIIYLNLIYS